MEFSFSEMLKEPEVQAMIFAFIVIATVFSVLMLIFYLTSRPAKERERLAKINKPKNYTEQISEELSKYINNFNKEALTNHLVNIFVRTKYAMANRDTILLRKTLDQKLFNYYIEKVKKLIIMPGYSYILYVSWFMFSLLPGSLVWYLNFFFFLMLAHVFIHQYTIACLLVC